MMTAQKGNKVYTVGEEDKMRYQSDGYDIYKDGNKIASGRGKTVSSEEYEKLKAENTELKAKLTEVGSGCDDKTAEILLRYADEHGISTGNAKTVKGIAKKIWESLSGDDPAPLPPEKGSE